jgi:hypothetical protein
MIAALDPIPPILEFSNPVFQPGRNTTVRRGRKWHSVPAARLRLADGSLSPPVSLQTHIKRFDHLCAADIAFEHDPPCRTVAGLLAELRRCYPGFAEHEEVTLCHFLLP